MTGGTEHPARLGDEQRVVAPRLDRRGQAAQLRRAAAGQVRVVLGVHHGRRPAALAAALGNGVALAG